MEGGLLEKAWRGVPAIHHALAPAAPASLGGTRMLGQNPAAQAPAWPQHPPGALAPPP